MRGYFQIQQASDSRPDRKQTQGDPGTGSQYLDEHYNQDIGLSELADRVGMSTAYLSVLFKTEVGTSYVKYLTDLRIKKAKKLLQDGYKVHEVSELVGYNNYRYFCDIFKKHEGMTPNEYKGNVWNPEG